MSAPLFKVFECIRKKPNQTAREVADKLKHINPNGVNYFSNKICILLAGGYITREKEGKGQFRFTVKPTPTED